MNDSTTKTGLWYALAAYVSWGIFPVYWKYLQAIPAVEVVSHRIVWSALFLVSLVYFRGHWSTFRGLWAQPRTLGVYFISGLLIGTNWALYIYAINSGQILQGSLGYYMNPLVNILLGLLIFKERLSPLRWCCVGLAATAVLLLVFRAGQFPWIAITLACSFSLYGVIRKKAKEDVLLGSAMETCLNAVPAVVLLWVLGTQSGGTTLPFFSKEMGLLLFGGIVSSLPLVWFSEAVRRLPFSTLGFIQYLSPTLQFLIAVFLYNEQFSGTHLIAFCLIWSALALLVYELRAHIIGKRPAI